jgi:hypothetical protein
MILGIAKAKGKNTTKKKPLKPRESHHPIQTFCEKTQKLSRCMQRM